jgi:hypothetical protein
LWIIFEHKGQELTRGYREMHNEQLSNFCFSPSRPIIRMMKPRRIVHVAGMDEVRKAYIILVGISERRRIL